MPITDTDLIEMLSIFHKIYHITAIKYSYNNLYKMKIIVIRLISDYTIYITLSFFWHILRSTCDPPHSQLPSLAYATAVYGIYINSNKIIVNNLLYNRTINAG